MSEITELLSGVSFFAGLDSNQLEVVIKRLKMLELEPGKIVFEEGDVGDSVYFIIEGQLSVVVDSGFDEKVKIASLNKGQSFGEMSIIDQLPRSATVVAEKSSTVLYLTKDDFDSIIEADQRIGIILLRSLSTFLCQHLRETNESLSDFLDPME